MDKTPEKLAATLPELPPHLRRAGRRILDHPHEVAMLSMRTLAAKAKVNPPTMLRLVRRIGFDNYETFRAVFQSAIAGGRFQSKAATLQEMRERTGKAGVVGGMLDAANENIARSLGGPDADALTSAAELMRKAPQIHVIGAGALHFMGVYLQYLSRAVLPKLRVPRANFNSLSEAMVGVGQGDVVLVTSVAPYALQTVKATELAEARGARVIALTDSRGSPLAARSEIVLIAGTDSPQFYPSMVGIVAMLETLIALVIAKGDPAMLARIAEIDRLRREENSYIDFAPEA
ncbi:MAG: MurR/RpiR family transcriptional regulator [Pseudolabrys sp.]